MYNPPHGEDIIYKFTLVDREYLQWCIRVTEKFGKDV